MKTAAHKLPYIIIALLCFGATLSQAQPLPLGEWRSHVTYHNARTVFRGANQTYVASSNSLFYRTEAGDLELLRKGFELSEAEVTALAVSENGRYTAVGYANGNIDWFTDAERVNFPTIKNANRTGDKTIYDLTFQGDSLWISSGVGMVLLNVRTELVMESWLQLGRNATDAAIYRTIPVGDSVFLATSDGLLANSLDLLTNRQDWTTWERLPDVPATLTGQVYHLERFQGQLWALGQGNRLYVLGSKDWILNRTFSQAVQALHAGEPGTLLAVTNDSLWMQSAAGSWQAYAPLGAGGLMDARQSADGTFWLAHNELGLVWGNGTNWQSDYPAGPPTDRVAEFAGSGSTLYAVPGGQQNGQPRQLPGQAYGWNGQTWEVLTNDTLPLDWTSLAASPYVDSLYAVSFNAGLGSFKRGGETVAALPVPGPFLAESGSNPYRFTDVEVSPYGDLWVAQYGGPASLYQRTTEGWTAYTIEHDKARYIEQILPSYSGYVFATLSVASGGGMLVYDPINDTARTLTTANGLPGSQIYALAEDQTGMLWVGGSDGVVAFPVPSAAFSGDLQAERPRVEFREAFVGVPTYALQVDGGDRIWLGTDQGAWLVDGLGGGVVTQFTRDNSPLPNNLVTKIGHIPSTGEVFFSTTNGTVSFQGDAPRGGNTHAPLKIFPNPITPDFGGSVALQGFGRNSYVRITDLAGNRLRDLRAQGSMATWDLMDMHGERVPAGVYLVVGTTQSGDESIVGRIVVQE